MKIIHAADVHLGAKMDSKFPKELAIKRREELRNTFRRMVDYANANGVKVIILAGDVFDSDSPFNKDKEFFHSVVRNNGGIDFLYLRGNHDIEADYSDEDIPNLKRFTDSWTAYTYGSIDIWGIEITAENATSMYSTLSLEKGKTNIVMLHGQVGDTSGKDRINLKKLRDKNIDYLALGHIHKPQSGKLDDRAEYAYSGTLEGRGFDETGEHGFILLDVGEKIERTFIPFSDRQIIEQDVDVSDVKEAYSASLKVQSCVKFDKRNIYRINLVGETELSIDDLSSDVATYLSGKCLYIDVKDKTVKKLDIKAYENDASLKGEFVRLVYSSADYTEDEKKRIISIGLKALNGGEIE